MKKSDMAGRLAKEATILQEKAEERLKNIDTNELSPSDAFTFLTEGINLNRACLLDIIGSDHSKLVEPTKESLTNLAGELEKLKSTDVNQLKPAELIRFLMTVIKIDWACQGIPESVANAHRINFD